MSLEKNKENQPSCCSDKPRKKANTFWQGLMYGLIPHTGCILFIIASVLGATVLMQFFKPLLMNRYIFHALIGVSIGFATLSSIIYLKKNRMLSWKGVRRKKGYLSIMYGSTIGINLVLFLLVFPMLANFTIADSGNNDLTGNSIMNIKVDIPCPGHAPLISNELKTIDGVNNVKFSFPNNFAVSYDSLKTSKESMLSLDVFEEYPAEVISEEINNDQELIETNDNQATSCGGSCGSTCGGDTGGCGGSCGGSTKNAGSCGGSCGGY